MVKGSRREQGNRPYSHFYLSGRKLYLGVSFLHLVTSSGIRSIYGLLAVDIFNSPRTTRASAIQTGQGFEPGPAVCDEDAQPAKLSRGR